MRNYCNNPASSAIERSCAPVPRVVVVGLASCFGCQLQITNREQHLLDVIGQIDLQYWQLASSDPMPDAFDVAIIEGAVTTQESLDTVRALREKASTIIAIGACANTAGIPGIAASDYELRASQVYDDLPTACGHLIVPRSVPSVIDVDFQVLCCPIDFQGFVEVLSQALYGSNRTNPSRTLCGDCKRNETSCFYSQGEICMGMVTAAGCGACCTVLGRPCNGCAGLSKDACLESAREAVVRYGCDVDEFDRRLQLFNQTDEALRMQGADREGA
jgi:sulfhydrogenase subunit delta